LELPDLLLQIGDLLLQLAYPVIVTAGQSNKQDDVYAAH
jgi:hypothetical protein